MGHRNQKGVEGSFTVSFSTILSVETLLDALNAGGSLRGWLQSPNARTGTLRLDLSRVEFAEFSALAQILLVVEAAARQSARVVIDLPAPVHVSAHLDGQDDTTQRATSKPARFVQFLYRTGFIAALRVDHIPTASVEIREHPDRPSRSIPDQPDEARPHDVAADAPQHHVRFWPFQWIRVNRDEDLRRSETIDGAIRGLSDLGLSDRDTFGLANIVLLELLKNVAEHSRASEPNVPTYALVGAVAAEPDAPVFRYASRPGAESLRAVANETGGRCLRLVVGDSGVGLLENLSASSPRELTVPQTAADGSELSTDERLALWALGRRSSGAGIRHDPVRGTRGLWRVRNAIEGYRGALLLSTADTAVGYLLTSPDPAILRASPNGAALGTMAEVTVIVGDGHRTSLVMSPAPQPSEPEVADLLWIRVSQSDDESLPALPPTTQARRGYLLTVDGGKRRTLPHEWLVETLIRASELAADAISAVVITRVDALEIEQAVDALHNSTYENDADSRPGRPFLLIDETAKALWCGGDAVTRDLLNTLLTNGPIPRNSSGFDDAALTALVDHYPEVVRHENGIVRLAIQPADLVNQLLAKATAALRDHLANGGPGVSFGAFRTPNLKLTDTWVEVDTLIESAVGTGISGLLLAAKVEAVDLKAVGDDVRVVQVGPVVGDVANAFAMSIGNGRGVHPMTEPFSTQVPVERLPPGTRAVLCVDVLLTGNTIEWAIREVLQWGVTPIAVVVLLDARDSRGPVEVRGLSVPVVSLAEATCGLPDPGIPLVDIDPVLRVPVRQRAAEADRFLWSPEEFLDACAEVPGVMGLGHVERPAHRHFTAYFDAGRAISTSRELRQRAARAIDDVARDWLRAGGHLDAGSSRPIAICHIHSTDGYAPLFAKLVAGQLAAITGQRQALELVQVPRAVSGSRYVFPDSIAPFREGSDAVVVDWGSFDANTMQQLIRLASGAGARRILGIVLLSQLTYQDEQALTMWHGVVGSLEGQTNVPTRVTFLTAVGITPLLQTDCSLCRLRRQLNEEVMSGGLPGVLSQHARNLATRLRPVSRDVAVRDGIDAFGSVCTNDDVIAYVRLRSLMISALRSTGYAAEVADLLTKLTSKPNDVRAHALIRLLAAEQQWLAKPPIALSKCRADVAQIAVAVALNVQVDVPLRLQSLMVLAHTSPDVFVARLPQLWRSALRSDELLVHIIWELRVIVRQRLGELSQPLSVFRDSVAACLREPAEGYTTASLSDELQYRLTRLLFALDSAEVEHERLTPQQAWQRLRDHYLFTLERHSDVEAAAINSLLLMEEAPEGSARLSEEEWRDILEEWSVVDEFLNVHVLPYTRSLSRILTGSFADELFTGRQRERLERLALDSASTDLMKVESTIRQLRTGVLGEEAFAFAWQEVLRDMRGWYRTVLAAGSDNAVRAHLARLIDGCPAPLLPILNDRLEKLLTPESAVLTILAPDNADSIEVFCHRTLLRNAVAQLIGNAIDQRHRSPTHAHRPIELQVEVSRSRSHARVVFRNTGTTPTVRPGRGITSMQRKLEDFGAELRPVTPDPGWTYQIELVLPLWTQDADSDNTR